MTFKIHHFSDLFLLVTLALFGVNIYISVILLKGEKVHTDFLLDHMAISCVQASGARKIMCVRLAFLVKSRG